MANQTHLLVGILSIAPMATCIYGIRIFISPQRFLERARARLDWYEDSNIRHDPGRPRPKQIESLSKILGSANPAQAARNRAAVAVLIALAIQSLILYSFMFERSAW